MRLTFEYKSSILLADDDIYLFSKKEEKEMPMHTHDFVEVVYIRDGSAIERVNGEIYEVKRGDIVFINCGSVHSFSPMDSFTYVNLCFRPEVLRSVLTDPDGTFSLLSLTAFDELRRENSEGMTTLSLSERDEVEAILCAMLREYEKKAPLYPQILSGYLCVFLSLLSRKMLAPDVEKSDVFRELADYIDRNLSDNLSLPELAQKCFYQPSYFSRLFREKFGMTLTEYINRRRITYATRLLAEDKMPIDEIISRSGFSTRSAFYRTFQKITGNTPGEYRKGKESVQAGEKSKD